MAITHKTKGSVLDDLGFSSAEAENLKIRAELMNALKQHIQKHKLNQTQAAKALGIDQARVSKLLAGRIDLFTIDRLVNMLAKIDKHVELKIAA